MTAFHLEIYPLPRDRSRRSSRKATQGWGNLFDRIQLLCGRHICLPPFFYRQDSRGASLIQLSRTPPTVTVRMVEGSGTGEKQIRNKKNKREEKELRSRDLNTSWNRFGEGRGKLGQNGSAVSECKPEGARMNSYTLLFLLNRASKTGEKKGKPMTATLFTL